MNRKLIVAALLCLPAMSWAASDAARDTQATQDTKFRKLDANHDGRLSRAEVRGIANYDSAFTQADDDRNGVLSADEFIKAEAIHDRQQVGAYVDDSVITAMVKGSLIKELKNLKVSVETYRGNVLLSGFVDNEAQIQKAVQIASSVKGVQSVKNGLAVR